MRFTAYQSRDEFRKIQDLIKEIDDYLESKKNNNGFEDLASVGKVVIYGNFQFYSHGVSLGSTNKDSFSTLATR